MVDKWSTTQQCLTLILTSGFVTAIILALIQTVSVFFNYTLPTIIRGYPPEDNLNYIDDEQSESD